MVARAGLAVGVTLDRPRLRAVRREVERSRAFDVAGKALGRRDLSARQLAGRLARAGIREEQTVETVAALGELGVVDDERVAAARASHLAERGWGDAGIRARLESEGIPEDLAAAAVRALPPERERARAVLRAAGDPGKGARRLAGRGFSPEAAEDVLGALDDVA